jgi:APA family basic amino acid/polyamine antiporter
MPRSSPAIHDLFRKKSVEELEKGLLRTHPLRRILGPWELIFLGIGAIVGTGIFVITGVAAADYAGPGVIFSFIFAGVASLFAALCYAEFASMVPIAGSAYTYSYASLGEIWAWIIGWDLILEYTVSVAAVAIGWSGYMANLFTSAGVILPAAFINPYGYQGGLINVPAILIIAGITALLILGIRESSQVNNTIVVIKLLVLALFLYLGLGHINTGYWKPFLPFGWSGVIGGAAIVFFAYIGFDAVSTAAEEVKDPQRNLPIGIIGSLIISTILYIAVSTVLTGIVPYASLGSTAAPVANALTQIGISWGSALVSVGAICGISSVLLVLLYGQSRIFFAMARDGLLPSAFASIHPRLRTPVNISLLLGIVTAVLASTLPLETVAELVNIGTLAAFIIVAIGVIILRQTDPERPRPFRVPLVPLVPLLAIISCGYLILVLPTVTHLRFVIWLAIGLVIYFLYARHRSEVGRGRAQKS